MSIAFLIARRSTCLRRQVGAVIVRNNRLLASGYNGVPSGIRHCAEWGGCLREQKKIPSGERHELCRGLHAEQNAIIQAAFYGTSIDGSNIYCTTLPCIVCAKMMINAGIKKIIYSDGYPDQLSQDMIAEAGIEMRQYIPENRQTGGGAG